MIFPVPNSSRADRYCLELIKKDGYPGVYTLSPVSGRIFVEKSDIKPDIFSGILPDIKFSIASLVLPRFDQVGSYCYYYCATPR